MKNQSSQFEFIPKNYFQKIQRKEIEQYPNQAIAIDFGCGEGDSLIAFSKEFPKTYFIGIEKLLGRARKTKRKLQNEKISNASIFRIDGEYALSWLFADKSIHRIYLLFPDPWQKRKHNKNRLLRPEILNQISRILKNKGDFILKTDDLSYFQQAEKICSKHKNFILVPSEEIYLPTTQFEKTWKKQSKVIYQLRAQKKDESENSNYLRKRLS